MHGDQKSLESFHTFLSKRLPFLGHIKLNSVQVVDHLGKIIPVPTQFCSTWKVEFWLLVYWPFDTYTYRDFDYIIKHYCKNRPGSRFVEQGDYEVLRTMDNRIISQSDFAVQSGMTVEMAIVMRQSTANQKNKCPCCDHLNLNATTHHDWIEW